MMRDRAARLALVQQRIAELRVRILPPTRQEGPYNPRSAQQLRQRRLREPAQSGALRAEAAKNSGQMAI